MIYIGKYRELSPKEKNYPYMKDNFEREPYDNQDKIVWYLKHGTEDMLRTKKEKDVFTGENIPMEPLGMNDGEYTWWNTLAYYVERYNLRLPSEFERKILSTK